MIHDSVLGWLPFKGNALLKTKDSVTLYVPSALDVRGRGLPRIGCKMPLPLLSPSKPFCGANFIRFSGQQRTAGDHRDQNERVAQ